MIDFVLVLTRNYPTANFGGSCADYSKIKWKDSVIPKPSEAQLLLEWAVIELDFTKLDKISELSALCEAEITLGFWSSALGQPYYYGSSKEDQLNLIGLVAAGTPSYFSVRNTPTDINKFYMPHDNAQLHTVMEDGKIYKLTILQKFNVLKDTVLATNTLAEIGLITW